MGNGLGSKTPFKGVFGSKDPSVTDGWGSEATRGEHQIRPDSGSNAQKERLSPKQEI